MVNRKEFMLKPGNGRPTTKNPSTLANFFAKSVDRSFAV
jgi:hypothetical protein